MNKQAIIIKTGEVVKLTGRTYETQTGTLHETSEAENGTLYHTDELEMIDDGDYWTFIERWLPDYSRNSDVAASDDLTCALDGEADEERLAYVRKCYGDTPEEWCAELERIDTMLFEQSIREYHRVKYLSQNA